MDSIRNIDCTELVGFIVKVGRPRLFSIGNKAPSFCLNEEVVALLANFVFGDGARAIGIKWNDVLRIDE